jgi:hypothetical protein
MKVKQAMMGAAITDINEKARLRGLGIVWFLTKRNGDWMRETKRHTMRKEERKEQNKDW